jgi:RNA polymerase sigma-70 factor (ECF subfamily)
MKKTIEIERLYESMSGRLYNASLRIVGCSADAEEIMHDSLLQYWRFKRKDEIRDIKGWLTSTCIRKSIDKLRERHRWKDFLEQYEDPAAKEEEESDMKYDIPSIQKALYTLPDNYRVILSLHLFEGYDYQEISQITGTNESTIRSLYMRGRQKLAAALKQKNS